LLNDLGKKKVNTLGGFGSGKYDRYGRKRACEEVKSIDIRQLKRKSRLDQGGYMYWSWTFGGKPSGDITMKIFEDRLNFLYSTINNRSGEKQKFNYWINLDYTPCNYRGRRVWFLCPICYTRRALLYYGQDGYFKCRSCANLNYRSSQKEKDIIYRIDNKIGSIRKKLGIPECNIWDVLERADKPKYMHYDTYIGLIKKLMSLYNERNVNFSDEFKKIEKHANKRLQREK
jgi:hypothetical protein